jgi:hypothetical protein
MEHQHGVLTYKGDIGDDLMGKVFGPGRGDAFFVVTGTTYDEIENKTKAELDTLTIDNQPPVVIEQGAP